MNEIILLKNISKTYPGSDRKRNSSTPALKSLSLTLSERENLVLLGPNGAGKTTLIKILTGLLSPSSGEVFIKGKKLFPGSPLQKLFGLTLQEIGLWGHLTLEETLLYSSSLYEIKPQTGAARAAQLIADFDLEAWKKKRVNTLSDGLKRRLNLTCALIHEPEILALDEPTLALDPQARNLFWKYLEKLTAQKKMTLIFSTHDMEEADRFGTKVAVLHKGELIELGAPSELKAKYGKGDEIYLECRPAAPKQIFEKIPGFVDFHSKNGAAWISILNGIQQIPAILSVLTEQGIQASNLKVKPNTLEQVFLSLTGKPLAEERME
jgi:ABC-2 type transport system ATP-binding protein